MTLTFNSNAQIKVTSSGYVGLGNTSPAYPIDITGTTAIHPSTGSTFFLFSNATNGCAMNPSASHNGMIGYENVIYSLNADYVYATNILYSSDERLKKNIRSLDEALPLIKKFRPVSFDYKFDYSKVEKDNLRTKLQNDDKNRLGFIAQEVQKILPQSVKQKDSDSTLCIQMIDFIPLLVKGMQEQTVRIDSLKSVIDELKASQNGLKSATITGTGNSLNSTATLYQNIPNPFSKETQIGFFIPEVSGTSVLYIYNMNGTQLQQYFVTGKGKQSIRISGSSLEPGMYLYALVIDDKEVDTKRMILTK